MLQRRPLLSEARNESGVTRKDIQGNDGVTMVLQIAI